MDAGTLYLDGDKVSVLEIGLLWGHERRGGVRVQFASSDSSHSRERKLLAGTSP